MIPAEKCHAHDPSSRGGDYMACFKPGGCQESRRRARRLEGKKLEETSIETRSRKSCPQCGVSVIWARIKGPAKSGHRAYVPFLVERCAAGTGRVALTMPMFDFPDGKSLLAELVENGTNYRSHRDHCTGRPDPTAPTSSPAAPPAFSAASFEGKRNPITPTPSPRRRPQK